MQSSLLQLPYKRRCCSALSFVVLSSLVSTLKEFESKFVSGTIILKNSMGGGNGQKSKMARERQLEKNKTVRGSQLESNKKAMNIQCKVCMQTFICTTSEAKCKEHQEAKHPKSDLLNCFPHLKN